MYRATLSFVTNTNRAMQSYAKGQEITLDEDECKRLLEVGYAEFVEDSTEAKTAPKRRYRKSTKVV